MALFSRNEGGREDEHLAADVATRALSVTAVETDFVAGVYEKLASVYDIIFGPDAPPGRGCRRCSGWAIAVGRPRARGGRRHGHQPGAVSARLQASPESTCRTRCWRRRTSVWRRTACATSALLQMDASALTFPDDSFDIVYAPYLVSVVPDPVAVVSKCAGCAGRAAASSS